jgi:glycosyltransferase involved in cell wall biosynthesis
VHNEPLISIVIYIRKPAGGLKKCLETLRLQMYKNIEIICVDTAPSEEHTAILNTYKECFDCFKIVHSVDSNSGEAWNNGLKIAQGKYIQFINSDCRFLLDMYKVFADASADKEPDISIINSALHKEDIIDIPFYELFDDEDLTKISDDMIYTCEDIHHILTKNTRVLNKIYKKEFLGNNNLSFAENNIYCEYLFNIQSLLKSSSVYINPEVYIRNTEQYITDGAYTEKVFDIFEIITKMQEYLILENLLRGFVFDFFNFICNSLDKYYQYCPDNLKREYFEKQKWFILSRFNSMPQEIQNNYRKIDEVNFLITSDFEEYNDKNSF